MIKYEQKAVGAAAIVNIVEALMILEMKMVVKITMVTSTKTLLGMQQRSSSGDGQRFGGCVSVSLKSVETVFTCGNTLATT